MDVDDFPDRLKPLQSIFSLTGIAQVRRAARG
jgi:hypothetical protein